MLGVVGVVVRWVGVVAFFPCAQEVGGAAPPTQVAVQFTYALNHWSVSDWEQPGKENAPPSPPCPFGVASDPIE